MKLYGQEIIEDGMFWHIHIKKPIYGTTVALNDKIIREAIRLNRILCIKTKGAYEEISPKAWMAKSIKIKKEFRIPGKPMTLWQGHVGEAQPKHREPGLQLTIGDYETA